MEVLIFFLREAHVPVIDFYLENEGSTSFRNIGTYLPSYTATNPGRQPSL
jgi:hypothetical protein